jgi:hypothetical protein
MLAATFPGWAIPDVVRAVYHTDIGEIKGVMTHPVLLRHKNTTPGTFMEALETREWVSTDNNGNLVYLADQPPAERWQIHELFTQPYE